MADEREDSGSLDILLYVWFAAQNLEFYERNLRGCGWAPSWHDTHTIFAPWSDLAPCFTYKKNRTRKSLLFRELSRFKTFQFHWEFFNSIVSMYRCERGSVSMLVCHLFVVRLPERSAVGRQAFCVVSDEASANFEPSSQSHFLLDCREQAILV